MRVVYDRADKLGFGKHRNRNLTEIASSYPSYFVWLHSKKVIRFFDDKDQRWFERRARKIRRGLVEAGVIADMTLQENGFDGDDDESELERMRGAVAFLTK